jgi:hypothetical protein
MESCAVVSKSEREYCLLPIVCCREIDDEVMNVTLNSKDGVDRGTRGHNHRGVDSRG